MRVLIVDDEEPARIELRRLLSTHAGVEVAGEAADVSTALALTAAMQPDVVFLDIRLAGESGFDYVGRLSSAGPRIVFVTAYDRYALRGFECNALDYLLKPVPPERLAETLRRVRAGEPPPHRDAGSDDAVFIRAGAVARLVPWRDIQSIAAGGNYTRLRLAGGNELIVLRTLKDWLALAPSGMFIQVHRSALVQCAAIHELHQAGGKKYELHLRDGTILPIGRDYAAAVREAFSRA